MFCCFYLYQLQNKCILPLQKSFHFVCTGPCKSKLCRQFKRSSQINLQMAKFLQFAILYRQNSILIRSLFAKIRKQLWPFANIIHRYYDALSPWFGATANRLQFIQLLRHGLIWKTKKDLIPYKVILCGSTAWCMALGVLLAVYWECQDVINNILIVWCCYLFTSSQPLFRYSGCKFYFTFGAAIFQNCADLFKLTGVLRNYLSYLHLLIDQHEISSCLDIFVQQVYSVLSFWLFSALQ